MPNGIAGVTVLALMTITLGVTIYLAFKTYPVLWRQNVRSFESLSPRGRVALTVWILVSVAGGIAFVYWLLSHSTR